MQDIARLVPRIERDEQQQAVVRDVLQRIHPIGDGRAITSFFVAIAANVVPARPHRSTPRHLPMVGMQYRDIAAVAEGAKQPPLFGRRLVEHSQRLVGMRCDDDVVEDFDIAVAIADFDPFGAAVDRCCAGGKPDAVGVAPGQSFDIGAAAAEHGAPLRTIADAKKAVAVLKTDECRRRVFQDRRRRRGPDRRRHWQQMIAPERRAVGAGVEVIAERGMDLLELR